MSILGEGSTHDINDSNGTAEKKPSADFTKENTKLFLSLHDNGDESYLYENKTEICKLEAPYNIPWYKFCLGRVWKDFTKDKMSENSLDGIVYDFSVDHNAIKKENIFNIHNYLMKKHNIKKCLDSLSTKFLCYLVLVDI